MQFILKSTRLYFLLLLSVVLCTATAFAQKQVPYKIVAFGQNGAKDIKITYDQILKNNKITCENKNFEVISFAISFLPKNGEYLGPFTIKGDQITGGVLNSFKKIRESHPPFTKIFIEDVQVREGDVFDKGASVVMTCRE